ncbi:tenascin-like isoform X2 [Saccostrea echinata]|uniref:tenascin-like isoform X2 n=1 Tax=Saccostrea echinata TaxID=191078 RepID=UPI002A82A871|nr:tenascin-like isoform X2 [Saccostrea echinata]
MKVPLILGILLVSIRYSIQREEKTETAAAVTDDGEEQHGHLSAKEVRDLVEESERSTKDEEAEEEERPVQLPARDVEELRERTVKEKKCSKKCAKNAQCVKGKCRCKKGFTWSKRRRQCVRRGRRCSKKCVKNARCVRGRCRCRRGFRWNRAKRQCLKRRRLPGVRWFKVGKGTACEHKNVTLHCRGRRVIRVFYAVYGRRNKHTCAIGKPVKTTRCRAKNSKKLVVKSCDGRRQCNLKASNGVFGDPCKGTFKYLTVIYGCRRPCVRNAFFNGNVCKCKKGYRGNGFRRCSKKKMGRNVEEEERRDVSDDEGLEINEDELERA